MRQFEFNFSIDKKEWWQYNPLTIHFLSKMGEWEDKIIVSNSSECLLSPRRLSSNIPESKIIQGGVR